MRCSMLKFSPEFLGRKLDDNRFVTILYKAFFDREPDTGGFDNWMEKLASGVSRDEVLQGFLGAEEFANLAHSFGIRVR